jgi:hypothetical protein
MLPMTIVVHNPPPGNPITVKDVQPVIVFVSDGLESMPLYWKDYAWTIASYDLIIHTIEVGENGNSELMQEIAAFTGGTYQSVPVLNE